MVSGTSGEAGRSGMVAGGGDAESDLGMPGDDGVAIFGYCVTVHRRCVFEEGLK